MTSRSFLFLIMKIMELFDLPILGDYIHCERLDPSHAILTCHFGDWTLDYLYNRKQSKLEAGDQLQADPGLR